MKSILISIQPKWCELIASGKKTIEVRKTRPKCETPFKCYIYCTKGENLYLGDGHEIECEESATGKSCYHYLANGKVIGEFVCDEVCEIKVNSDDFGIWWHETIDEYCSEDNMCLTFDEVSDYLGYHHGFGWHISDLVIYDEPKCLSEFKTLCKYSFGCDECHEFDGFENTCRGRQITRPPQLWVYVDEEVKEDEEVH